MAIYDNGTASLAANGQVTGIGTQWTMPLTLIRVGATIVFKTEPVKIYTISEIISDTQINVYNPNSETVTAGTGYAILAHDGITVQGLAQDVAETLRYYQSRETEVADAVDAFNNFDSADFESKVTQVNTQHGDVVTIGAQVSSDSAQVNADKNAAAASAASASSDKDAAAASAQEAADYAASLDTSNLLRKDLNFSDVADKQASRENLDVYSKDEVLSLNYDVRAYGAVLDGVTDDSAALKRCLDQNKIAYIPAGKTLYVASTVVTPRDFRLYGGEGAGLKGATGIEILRFPQYNGVVTGTIIDGIRFYGDQCTAISVEVPSSATSGFYRYIPRLSVHNCVFNWELSYGINANLIFSDIFNCQFGYVGVGDVKRIKSIKSVASQLEGANNNPNFNVIRKCYFYSGDPSTTHIEFYRGGQITIRDCDFEQGGQAMKFDLCYNVNIDTCWIESCSGNEGVISIKNVATSFNIKNCKIYRSAGLDGGSISYYASTIKKLRISDCDFEQQSSYPLLNKDLTGSASIKVPPNNCVEWFDNRVVSGASGIAYTTDYNYRGSGTLRASIRFNMSTGSLINSSVPVTYTKKAVGSWEFTFTNLLGFSDMSQMILDAYGYNSYVRIVPTSKNSVLVNCYDGSTNALTDVTDLNLRIY